VFFWPKHEVERLDFNTSVQIKVSSSAVAFGSVSQTILFIVSLIYVLLIWQLCSKVRECFDIPGSCCFDYYCCVWWRSCCTTAQMATHVKSYKPGSCDFGPLTCSRRTNRS
jgi:hypothetical protein